MTVWGIADLHLSFGVPGKEMDLFGEHWKDHPKKIETRWRECVGPDDLVLIAGDTSWAMEIEEVAPDLQWIDQLPGIKVLIRGNHDYWWGSLKKVKEALPPSLHIIQNDAFQWNEIGISGARLWDSPEYQFNSGEPSTGETAQDNSEKIFIRELHRLEMSLKCLSSQSKVRIAMTHYPPIGQDLRDSRTSALLEKYGISVCVFGHLHNIPPNEAVFGTKNGIRYILAACDHLNFAPVKVM